VLGDHILAHEDSSADGHILVVDKMDNTNQHEEAQNVYEIENDAFRTCVHLNRVSEVSSLHRIESPLN
jgi:hypothetical protein